MAYTRRLRVSNLSPGLSVWSLAFARPLLVRFGSQRYLGSVAVAVGSRIWENPTRETSGRDVILTGDVIGSLGSAGVPTEAASLELSGKPAQACRLQGPRRAFTAPCVCPAGPSGSWVKHFRAQAGAMGRSERRSCPSPARTILEPRRRQRPAAGPRMTLAAPGSVTRALGHAEEPSVQ